MAQKYLPYLFIAIYNAERCFGVRFSEETLYYPSRESQRSWEIVGHGKKDGQSKCLKRTAV